MQTFLKDVHIPSECFCTVSKRNCFEHWKGWRWNTFLMLARKKEAACSGGLASTIWSFSVLKASFQKRCVPTNDALNLVKMLWRESFPNKVLNYFQKESSSFCLVFILLKELVLLLKWLVEDVWLAWKNYWFYRFNEHVQNFRLLQAVARDPLLVIMNLSCIAFWKSTWYVEFAEHVKCTKKLQFVLGILHVDSCKDWNLCHLVGMNLCEFCWIFAAILKLRGLYMIEKSFANDIAFLLTFHVSHAP